MPFLIILAALAFLALIFGPQVWVQRTMREHAGERPDLPGTGAELARHLLDEAGLESVRVEMTEEGDHYDPQDKAVRLTDGNFHGRSVTAAAVAAHEVSH
ncbi:MAG: zinc metallopeptidase, partial [Beijerinckiaceae bacterium]|nr:zinc metallopeptidase [Beijerinckiaceae bacterium]